jgi:hypothetical protein
MKTVDEIGQTDIQKIARQLVRESQNAEPGITRSYLFPSEGEIRLIHLDNNSPASEKNEAIAPFYFGPDRQGDIPYPSAIALIRPEEKGHLNLPQGWGDWDGAEEVCREQD